MINPNRPSTELKISMTRILTNLKAESVPVQASDAPDTYKLGSAASARAALLPLIPTEMPQIMLHAPTNTPDQNNAYPV